MFQIYVTQNGNMTKGTLFPRSYGPRVWVRGFDTNTIGKITCISRMCVGRMLIWGIKDPGNIGP